MQASPYTELRSVLLPACVITSYSIHYTKLYELIKNDIAVYIAHTNLDITEGGMNDWMAEALGFEPSASLEDIHVITSYSIHYTKLYEVLLLIMIFIGIL